MPVDWDRLVIGPTIGIFGDQVRFWWGERCFGATAVFDEQYLSLTPMGQGGEGIEAFSLGAPGAISTARPVLGIRIADFLHVPEQGDRLDILSGKHAGERYVVKEIQPDGHGHAKLLLNEYDGL